MSSGSRPIWSYTEAADRLGVNPRTVSDLMRALRRVPKRVRSNGRAKGCDESDMEAMRVALTPRRSEPALSA